MRRFLLAFLLGLLVAAPVTAAPPNQIEWSGVEVHFGDFQPASEVLFTTNRDNPWSLINCSDDGGVVYAQYLNLTPGGIQSTGYTFGPTPLWQGGGVTCVLQLLTLDPNRGFKHLRDSDPFVVLP